MQSNVPMLYTVPEAANLTRLSTKRIYAMIREKRLRALQIGPLGKLHITEPDLLAFLNSCETADSAA